MSEEIELNEGDIVENVTPENFSFFDMLAGITYPTDEVTVSLDEGAAHAAAKLARDVDLMVDPTQEEIDSIMERHDALQKRIEDSKVTFYLRGVPDDLIIDAKDRVDDMFADKRKQMKAADGTIRKYLPEDQAVPYSRMLNATVFALQIEKVVFHKNGAEWLAPIDPDNIAAFYDKAPKAAQEKLSRAIFDLRVDSSEYEGRLDEGFFPNS